MGRLTTHVLDIANGQPAAGMRIDLSALQHDGYRLVKTVHTDLGGRTSEPLMSESDMASGCYELLFHVAEYFARTSPGGSEPPFLDKVPVRFGIADAARSYHVPLLVSRWSYTTYRGS